MRETLEKNNNKLTEAQARDVIDRCMKLLYFRDGRAYDKVNIFISKLIQLKLKIKTNLKNLSLNLFQVFNGHRYQGRCTNGRL
jgi:hypothetical protein